MSDKSCVDFVFDINSAASYAYNFKFSGPTAFRISLIYTVKNNGPKTEPYGTHSIFPNDDLTSLSISKLSSENVTCPRIP